LTFDIINCNQYVLVMIVLYCIGSICINVLVTPYDY